MTNEHNDTEIDIEVVEVDDYPTASEPIPETDVKEQQPKPEAELLPDAMPPVDKKVKSEDTTTKNNTQNEEYDDFIFTKYHGKKKSLFTSVANHNTVGSYSSHNHFVKEVNVKNRKRKRPLWQKLLIALGFLLAGLLTLAVIAVVVFFILKNVGMSQLTDADIDIVAPVIENVEVSVDEDEDTITYNGKTYVYNKNMTSILCMGIDKRDGLGLEDDIVGTGGQADALYLVAMDTATGKTSVIAVSRDIYGDINVYSADGNYTGTEKAQLCLAYAYGDGKEESCKNTVGAVERLFYSLVPVQSYFAMDLYAIDDLNDAVGGVQVVLDGTLLGVGEAGDEVYLHGEYARKYLQHRNVEELESSADRMNRQMHYLERFSKTAIDMTKKDLSTPVTLFNIVKDNSVTNLNASKISALGYTVATSGTDVAFKKVPGEVIRNGEYAEYVVDQQGMLELILSIYYKPVN